MLTHNTINQLQTVISAMEMHEPKVALDAVKKIKENADEMRLRILGLEGGHVM